MFASTPTFHWTKIEAIFFLQHQAYLGVPLRGRDVQGRRSRLRVRNISKHFGVQPLARIFQPEMENMGYPALLQLP